MEAKRQVERLLKKHATLLRKRNHLVYQLPSGRRVVASKSASCHRAWRNKLAQLRKMLREEGIEVDG